MSLKRSLIGIRTGAAIVTLAVAGVLLPYANAQENSPCNCWFLGYEDGLEYPWGQRSDSEHYTNCSGKGQLNAYEDGFLATLERQERKCPYQ